jgi:signal transduction histidine kinase
MRRTRSRGAAIALAATVVIYLAVGQLVAPGYALSFFGNTIQALIQAVAIWAFLLNARITRGHRRAFWVLWALGGTLWFAGQLQWIYYENILSAPMPNPGPGDILFFIHTVPMLAATSLQPHADVQEGDHRPLVGYLNFSLLLVWWLFLYAYLVGGHQFIQIDEPLFSFHFNVLYAIENVTVMVALAVLCFVTRQRWRTIYVHLFIATSMYCLSSFAINVTIDAKNYYTGSIYDIPLLASIAWYAYAGFLAYWEAPRSEPALMSLERQEYFHSRLAALAVLTLPLFAAWPALRLAGGQALDRYRITATLVTMVLLMGVLFAKQALLDRTLRDLLKRARDAYDNLHALQKQMLQAEKLVSMGRLVAGAAHEINNPLTAIIGYSDLLVGEADIKGEERQYAEKILTQARRTKSLVNHLLTFAQQGPMQRGRVDLNTTTEKALRLQELGPGRRNIEIVRRLEPELTSVIGDENQLLQVLVHILNNAVDAMLEHAGTGTAIVETRHQNGSVTWSCSDNGPGIKEPDRIFDPFFTTKPVGKGTGLGLSASYGIVREHGGTLICENLPYGGARFVISLPTVAGSVPLVPQPAALRS